MEDSQNVFHEIIGILVGWGKVLSLDNRGALVVVLSFVGGARAGCEADRWKCLLYG